MTADDQRREDAFRLGGDISQWLFDQFCSEYRHRYGGEDFEFLAEEDFADHGYPEDAGEDTLLLVRKRDGQVFEVEVEAMARPAPTEAERLERAGQLRLPGVAS